MARTFGVSRAEETLRRAKRPADTGEAAGRGIQAVLQLKSKCACGGTCPRCTEEGLQAKTKVGRPGDALEREADAAADRAVAGGAPFQESAAGSGTAVSGAPLAPSIRRRAESVLGAGLGHVRVHAGEEAARAAASLNARAFAFGPDIWIGAGESASDARLMVHEAAHVVQQSRPGGSAGMVQRQEAGTAAARRATTYHFSGCSESDMEILDRTIRQAYLMNMRARDALTDLILAIIQAESSEYDLAPDALALRHVIRRLYGDDGLDTIRAIRNNFTTMGHRFRADREVACHDGSERNRVASAEVGGTRIWIGPRFFHEYTDALNHRPRIFIHEIAHNAGIEHDMTGLAMTAGSEETTAAQVAHHADSYAELAYRIYTRDFFGALDRELDI
jgi:hypothetical protein